MSRRNGVRDIIVRSYRRLVRIYGRVPTSFEVGGAVGISNNTARDVCKDMKLPLRKATTGFLWTGESITRLARS